MDKSTRSFAKSTLPLVLVSDIASVVIKRDLRKFKRLFKMSALLMMMRQSEMKGGIKGGLLLPTFLAQGLLRCFTWQFSLYVMIRQFMMRFQTNFLYTPKAIFSIHLFSWFLLGHKADRIEPSYLTMWTQMMPYYKREGRDKWLREFSSEATSKQFYLPEQVSKQRLKQTPFNYAKSVMLQFPFCVAMYLIGFAQKLDRKMKAKVVLQRVVELLLKSLTSSAVLGMLPYSMCAFPALYGNFVAPLFGKVETDENGDMLIKRNLPLNLVFTAAISTFVFLREPSSRLKVMVGYMIWRVFESLLRTYVLGKKDVNRKRVLAACFTALTAHWCFPVKS